MSCENFAKNRTAELALHILVEAQGNDVLDGQWGSTDRVLVEFADVGQNVSDLICCPISCARLQEET